MGNTSSSLPCAMGNKPYVKEGNGNIINSIHKPEIQMKILVVSDKCLNSFDINLLIPCEAIRFEICVTKE